MNIGGIIGGTIAAIIGAAAWAAIAYFGKVEIGYLAWGIGLLVGLGVSAGSRTGGIGAAAVAIVLTILSLLGGKYAAVTLAVHDIDAMLPAFEMDDEGVKVRLANISVMDSGKEPSELEFRNGADYESAESLDDYPAKLARQIQREYDGMSEDEIEAVKQEAESEYNEFVAAFESAITQQGFMDSFSGFDIIFFLLGIFTAGKVALSDVIDEGQ